MANTSLCLYIHRSRQICGANTGLMKHLPTSITALGSRRDCSEQNKSKDTVTNEGKLLPEEPTTCCMSGCANCVWIDYAEELSKHYKDGGEKARKLILSKVTDPAVKAFLMVELQNIGNKSE